MRKRFGYNTIVFSLTTSFILSVLIFVFSTNGLSQDGRSWVLKVTGGGLGDPFSYNPQNHNTVFCATGDNRIWRSLDRGRNWHIFSTLAGGNQIKAIHVHPIDTLKMLACQEAGPPDRIMKTTNGGQEWYPVWFGETSFYGRPMAYEPAHPDLVYSEGWDSLWCSTDFGETWTFIRTTLNVGGNGTGFDRWDCAVIRPDSANILYVGDVTNGLWKTTDGGYTWARKNYHTGEYPIIGIDPFNPLIAYSARWIGAKGFIKTTDGGETWFSLPPLAAANTWGMAVSLEHPGFVCTGTYGDPLGSTGGIYLSWDYGNNWTRTYDGLNNGSNYGMLALDSLTVFALQANGIWKLEFPIGSITVTSPNGNENWISSTYHNITWTSINVSTVKLEYTTDDGTNWIGIASSIPAAQELYQWTVPGTPSSNCKVRVSDNYFGSVYDVSDTTFTIVYATITLNSPNGNEVWYSNTLQDITWSVYNIPSIKIFYSTDNGSDWLSITSNYPTASGSYHWLVPFTPSTMCRVKIVDASNDPLFDISDTVFTICTTTGFVGDLKLKDNGNILDTLRFGELAGATDGIDPSFGEVELPPKPGVDTFDVRWKIEGTNGLKDDLRDTLSMVQSTRIFTLEMQPGPAGFPFTLSWNPDSLPPDEFILIDKLTGGDSIHVNMLVDSVCVVTNPNLYSLQIIHNFVTTSVIPVSNRWNILSVPLNVNDGHKNVLFPTSVSSAYEYNGGYISRDSLQPGKGYWLKFSGDQLIPISGKPRLMDSISVSQGWNMIGCLNQPAVVSEIVNVPPTMTRSNFYGYRNGYVNAETLFTGKGYWVKVSQSGKLVLSASAFFGSSGVTSSKVFAGSNIINFADSKGNMQSLYFGTNENESKNIDCFEMPPAPPNGVLDVRFASNRILENMRDKNSDNHLILISSAAYPLKISWKVSPTSDNTVLEIDGKEISLHSQSSIQISDRPSRILLKNTGSVLTPTSFKLEQNYPNPFNPSTTISFQIPKAAFVTLKIYNIIGQVVSTLVNEKREAGSYSIKFDATSLSSGLYFYQLQADNFTAIRKLLLLR